MFFIAPDLISEVTSLTSNGIISVMVDVNEFCAGGDEYTILVNIVDGNNIPQPGKVPPLRIVLLCLINCLLMITAALLLLQMQVV